MRPPHGCRCCGLTARHDDDCLVPALALVVVERDRLRALICEWREAERNIRGCGHQVNVARLARAERALLAAEGKP